MHLEAEGDLGHYLGLFNRYQDQDHAKRVKGKRFRPRNRFTREEVNSGIYSEPRR